MGLFARARIRLALEWTTTLEAGLCSFETQSLECRLSRPAIAILPPARKSCGEV